MGAYLIQQRDGVDGIMSMTFNATQRRWNTPEREAYAIVKALHKFEYLLRDVRFTLHTDHQNLVYIRDTGSKKVHGWKVAIQEYLFDLVHVQGKDNIAADVLSHNLAAATCNDIFEEEVNGSLTDVTGGSVTTGIHEPLNTPN